MGIAESLLSFGVKDVAEGIGTLVKDIRSAITGEPSPEKIAEINIKLLELENLGMQAQSKINEIEAANTNVFVAGWRPFIGWICGFGLGTKFIFIPIGVWVCSLLDITPIVPVIETGELMTLILGMLGLGGLRTFEKFTGSNKR